MDGVEKARRAPKQNRLNLTNALFFALLNDRLELFRSGEHQPNPKTMKNTYLTIVTGLLMALCAHAEPPKKEPSALGWYQRGIAATKAGKVEDARLAFQRALQLNPGLTQAKYQLSRIPELNARTKIARRKALFKSTVIPKIDLRDATLKEALDALNEMATTVSDKKFSPNFIIQDPGKKFEDKRVKLKMNNIPLSAALNYLLESVGGTARYDEYATPIKPMGK